MSIDQRIRELDPAAHVPDDLGWSSSADALLAHLRRDPDTGGNRPTPQPVPADRTSGSHAPSRWLAPPRRSRQG